MKNSKFYKNVKKKKKKDKDTAWKWIGPPCLPNFASSSYMEERW